MINHYILNKTTNTIIFVGTEDECTEHLYNLSTSLKKNHVIEILKVAASDKDTVIILQYVKQSFDQLVIKLNTIDSMIYNISNHIGIRN